MRPVELPEEKRVRCAEANIAKTVLIYARVIREERSRGRDSSALEEEMIRKLRVEADVLEALKHDRQRARARRTRAGRR